MYFPSGKRLCACEVDVNFDIKVSVYPHPPNSSPICRGGEESNAGKIFAGAASNQVDIIEIRSLKEPKRNS
jgi:hypothetical protein